MFPLKIVFFVQVAHFSKMATILFVQVAVITIGKSLFLITTELSAPSALRFTV